MQQIYRRITGIEEKSDRAKKKFQSFEVTTYV